MQETAKLKAESCNIQVMGQAPLWVYTFYQATDKGKSLMIFSVNTWASCPSSRTL